VKHDSVRIVVGDELGYTRYAQSADGTATAFSVVARWGQGARAAGVERLSTAHGNDEEPSSWVAGACRHVASLCSSRLHFYPPSLACSPAAFSARSCMHLLCFGAHTPLSQQMTRRCR
jgi:hypothetical protein